MSGETPFDPGSTQNDLDKARVIDMNAFTARMNQEQLARYEADMERDKREGPLREARATVDRRRNQAAAAVRARELTGYKEERAANKLLCLDIASAIHENKTDNLDLYVVTYLNDKLSFKQPDSIEQIQDIFNRLSNRPEELLNYGQPELQRVEVRTVYCEVPVQNEKIMLAITVTVDYTYNAQEPLVTFVVSKEQTPKNESLQAVVPLNKPKEVAESRSILGKMFTAGKKLFGFE